MEYIFLYHTFLCPAVIKLASFLSCIIMYKSINVCMFFWQFVYLRLREKLDICIKEGKAGSIVPFSLLELYSFY